MKTALLITIAAFGAHAQPPELITDPLAEIRAYLNLTTDQNAKLSSLNNDYQRFIQTKIERTSQVNLEIDQETTKSALDASALGVRYAELEVICRESKAAAAALPTSAAAVLTPAQQAKLAQLAAAQKLTATISQAQLIGLLPGTMYPPADPVLPGCRPVTINRLVITQGTSEPAPTSAQER